MQFVSLGTNLGYGDPWKDFLLLLFLRHNGQGWPQTGLSQVATLETPHILLYLEIPNRCWRKEIEGWGGRGHSSLYRADPGKWVLSAQSSPTELLLYAGHSAQVLGIQR